MTELTMTSHKNTKSLGCIVPKLEAKLTFKPTYDMILAKRQSQVCAYLFQKTSDAKLMAEILVLAGKSEATRADLQCLIPTRVISDLVVTLAAERINCIQVDGQQFTDRQSVWCLPPSFVFDFESRMQLSEIREKYCDHWMPPFPNLNFIYVPLKSVDGHWFLMIVHLKNEVIYHLDTYCPGGCAAYRHLKIKKV
ncbi:Ulp1 protease family carboxy-terminal domain protein, partial [Trifolium medium]|nr:Ulp1 protease family carboxy-terminal domain protein [Trifolium medium]